MAVGLPEMGMGYLASNDWLPPPVDPRRVLDDVHGRNHEACLGRVFAYGLDDSNIVERLATAYALLRNDEGAKREVHLAVLQTLEAIGFDVSSTFAERGSDAYFLLKTINALRVGLSVDLLDIHLSYQCLGRLWAAAFSAPSGFDHYIARSASGGEPPHLGFFSGQRPQVMSLADEGEHLFRLTNLLQAAVAARELPAVTVGKQLSFSDWRSPAWAIFLPRPEGRAQRVVIHSRTDALSSNCNQHTVKLVEGATNQVIASIRGVVIEGETGSYDDFLHVTPLAGEGVERVISSVFAPSQVVGLYPRVRWLLESSQNRLFRLLVLEGMYASSTWRRRGIGQTLVEQLLVETGMCDVALGRPMAFTEAEDDNLPFGVQAGYTVAKLALARYFANMGGEFLMSGTMGMRSSALRTLHLAGEKARLQQA